MSTGAPLFQSITGKRVVGPLNREGYGKVITDVSLHGEILGGKPDDALLPTSLERLPDLARLDQMSEASLARPFQRDESIQRHVASLKDRIRPFPHLAANEEQRSHVDAPGGNVVSGETEDADCSKNNADEDMTVSF